MEVLGTLLDRYGAPVVQRALRRCLAQGAGSGSGSGSGSASPPLPSAEDPSGPRLHAGNATDVVTRARSLLVAGDVEGAGTAARECRWEGGVAAVWVGESVERPGTLAPPPPPLSAPLPHSLTPTRAQQLLNEQSFLRVPRVCPPSTASLPLSLPNHLPTPQTHHLNQSSQTPPPPHPPTHTYLHNTNTHHSPIPLLTPQAAPHVPLAWCPSGVGPPAAAPALVVSTVCPPCPPGPDVPPHPPPCPGAAGRAAPPQPWPQWGPCPRPTPAACPQTWATSPPAASPACPSRPFPTRTAAGLTRACDVGVEAAPAPLHGVAASCHAGGWVPHCVHLCFPTLFHGWGCPLPAPRSCMNLVCVRCACILTYGTA
jgi:hypothetical protein